MQLIQMTMSYLLINHDGFNICYERCLNFACTSIRSFASSFWVHELLVCVFVFDLKVRFIKTRIISHDVSDDTGKRLPLFFTFFLVIFKEEVIWFENWESFDLDFAPKIVCNLRDEMLNLNHTILHMYCICFITNYHWLH